MTNPYPTRTHTYVAGDQVASSDLNAIQDGIIDVGDAVETLQNWSTAAGQDIVENQEDIASLEGMRVFSASCNDDDPVHPDKVGGGSMWLEVSTDGAGVVLVDDTIDWRDRVLIVTLFMCSSSAQRPGQAGEDSVAATVVNGTGAGASTVHAMAYTVDGQTGSAATPGVNWVPDVVGWTADRIVLFARDSDGALCLTKLSVVDTDMWILGKVDYSPDQRHH